MARAAVPRGLRRLPWLEATVRDITSETPRARTITLDVDSWNGHRPGQHLDVRLTADDGYQAQRPYSIASAPEQDGVSITVEPVGGGEVSAYLAGDLTVGDSFEVRGPIGGYFTWSVDEPGPLLLIGGGVGLAPLMSMLRHRAVQQATVQAHLLVSARSAEDLLYRAELETLGPADGLRIERTYTRVAPRGWTGWRRRVDGAMLDAVTPGPDARCFVCGPTPFVELVNDLLVAGGHDPRNVHSERFGGAGG